MKTSERKKKRKKRKKERERENKKKNGTNKIETDPLKDAVDLTPIPCSLQNIIKLIQAEEVEHQRPSGSLETGPCLEYLLQKRVLEELVEFAKVDVNIQIVVLTGYGNNFIHRRPMACVSTVYDFSAA